MNMNKRLTLVIVACALLIGCVQSKCTKQTSRQLQTYKIDLDLPASQRLIQPASDYKQQIAALIAEEKAILKLDPIILKYAEAIASDIDSFFPYPFNEEMKGIAEASGANLGDIVFANLIYDFTAFCTSIVAKQANGQIIHGRNLDYNPAGYLRNVTYMAEFYRGGKLLFSSVQLAGYVGILSGHKYNAFTFSIDERDQGGWWENLIFAIFDKRAEPMGFLSRYLMENDTTFDAALARLSNQDLIAPAYFILGGVNGDQGAVVTRFQEKLVDVWRLNASSPGIEQWYLLETNYDHWTPPPASDDRRTPGMRAMNATTQAKINYDTLFDVLTIDPVCQPDTVYSVVMSASQTGDKAIQVIVR